jgi:hypothetical protein
MLHLLGSALSPLRWVGVGGPLLHACIQSGHFSTIPCSSMDTSLYSLLSGDQRAVVLDIGAHLTKFGCGGDPIPSIIPTHLHTLNDVKARCRCAS